MAYDPTAPLNRLQTLLASITSIHGVQLGVPQTISQRVHAYVTLAGVSIDHHTNQVLLFDQRYRIYAAYRLDGAASAAHLATAEQTIAGVIRDVVLALTRDLTLGGTCASVVIDSLADGPEYQIHAGVEFREYPLVVTCRQYDSHG